MRIVGKTALVTGASRGIGRAIALELARNGASCLLLLARDPQALAQVAAEIEVLGVRAVPLVVDLAQMGATSIAVSQAWRDYGPIHLLVNCAGIAHQSLFLQSQLHQVQAEINVNLLGLYNITRSIARRMASQQEGAIVNVSSLMGKLAAPTMATYSATKFAILGFTQALRGELADKNVKVIALLPSLTETDMVRKMNLFRWAIPNTPEQIAEALVKGLKSESSEILVGWQSHLAIFANSFAPWLVEKLIQLASPLPVRKPQSLYTPLTSTEV